MLKKMYFTYVLMLAGVLGSVSTAQAQQSPQEIRDKAYRSIDVGMEIMQQAGSMIRRPSPTKEQLKTAIALYIRAGKRFEQAASTLTSLGPEYYSEQDVAGAQQALARCIQMIKKCRQRLEQMRKY